MPSDKPKKETDGDTTTAFEDTREHQRTGLRPDASEPVKHPSDWQGPEI